ncbi:sugar phosphate isomerase/epimerase family protein [Singulisphaera acidiphila]|uniref:Sugar phosphate isomerase/epimerase n=1 Tax=Singulisphaera acidiphila (strain ATCC BAA-1392 / DSM 18658 / VKM B-2454 / MOB10) TaxID=886293 RepID=L0DPN1_SINAD|nr:sugar phosphate isomerase/epimerase family protein [Singulisphaera acidiphila]AGA30803.1 sugar phosphate isomerase/epimerase [Singulisphaera acidiphila DSM 18658]
MFSSFNARALGLTLSTLETIELASAAGFGGVDFLMRELRAEQVDPRAVRTRLEDLGLKAGAWSLPVDWRGDAARFAEDLEQLSRYAEAASVLGASRTGTWVMPETLANAGLDGDRASILASTAELHIERLGAIARVLANHGVRLGLEVIGVESFRSGRGIPFVTRLAELDLELGAIWQESTNLGILVDGFHLYAANEEIEAGFRWGVDRIVWVHVADLPASSPSDRSAIQDHDRGLPGENGAIDTAQLLKKLAEAGYSGPVTAEPGAKCRSIAGRSAKEIARLVASAMNSVWPQPTP